MCRGVCVCVLIPLFLMKQTHAPEHTPKCSGAIAPRVCRTTPVAVVLDILSIPLCGTAPVCLMGLLTDTGCYSLIHTHTQTLCSNNSAAISISLNCFFAVFSVLPDLSHSFRQRCSLMDFMQNEKYANKALLAQNTNIYQRTGGR